MSEFNLPEKEKLQGNENFTIWEVTINNYLKAKKLLKYIEYDCAYHKKSPQKGKKLTEDELNYNEEIEAQDALASTIIFANVSDCNEYTTFHKFEPNVLFFKMNKFFIYNLVNFIIIKFLNKIDWLKL